MKKPTLSYGIIGAVVAVATISGMMMYSTTLLSTTAYAQPAGRPDTVMSFGDASPEAERMAIEIAIAQLWNMTNGDPSITFSEDGTLTISHSINTPNGMQLMMVMGVPHNMTPENGYEINNGVLTAPNGTQIFP